MVNRGRGVCEFTLKVKTGSDAERRHISSLIHSDDLQVLKDVWCVFYKLVSPQGVDLRQYSKQVESELQRIEQASIKDCILPAEKCDMKHHRFDPPEGRFHFLDFR